MHLNYEQYNELIQQNTQFIKDWLKEQGLSTTDPEALHFGIQKFMGDTLRLKGRWEQDQRKVKLPKGHLPFHYDYIDYEAKEDRRNYFVTKTLATGSGQCHTLPVTYLILAEALGIEANLSISPRHSFVQFENGDGKKVNYETTVDRFLSDQFYLETLPTMAKAKYNKLILTTLTKKQVVASVLIDLANSFVDEHYLANEQFLHDCLDKAATQFPNKTYIGETYFTLKRNLKIKKVNDIIRKHKISTQSEFLANKEVVQAYTELKHFVEATENYGYRGFPESVYMRIIEYQDHKGRLQQARKINTKSIKSLFIE